MIKCWFASTCDKHRWGYVIKSSHIPLVGDFVSLVVKDLSRGTLEWVQATVVNRIWRFETLHDSDDVLLSVEVRFPENKEVRAHSELLSSNDEEVAEQLIKDQIEYRKRLRSKKQ